MLLVVHPFSAENGVMHKVFWTVFFFFSINALQNLNLQNECQHTRKRMLVIFYEKNNLQVYLKTVPVITLKFLNGKVYMDFL